MKVKAIYPGSFDPITYGHIDIIQRLQPIYGELTVLVAHSPKKTYLFSAEERAHLIRKCLKDLPGINIDMFDGLTVEYAKKVQASVIIRGLRAVSDFEYESAMANMNKKLGPEVETMIVFTRPEYGHISSRMVKEVAFYRGDLTGIVPPAVAEALKSKYEHKSS